VATCGHKELLYTLSYYELRGWKNEEDYKGFIADSARVAA
jgi:hypothetical protein